MDMSSILNQMVVLFCAMAIGYIACKARILNAAFNQTLSRLILHICMPGMILASVMNVPHQLSNAEVWVLLGISFGLHAFFILVALGIPKLFRLGKSEGNLYRFLLIFSNVGFMGFPVVSAIFGPDAVFYASIFNIPFNLLAFTLGVVLVAGRGVKLSLKKLLLSPGILVSVAALVIYLLDIPFPAFVRDTADLLGQITTPGAMLVIGATLAAIPLKRAFTQWKLYPLLLLKLIVLPVLVWLILRPFITSELTLGVTVVIAAMPCATNCTLFCNEYGGDAELASIGVFLSTLASVVTIPLLMFCLFA